VHERVHPFFDCGVTVVAGREARGFNFGSLVAWELGVGFVPAAQAGKLPAELEYSSAGLEMHSDALRPGDRVLLVDDLLATGGTAAASTQLTRRLGAEVSGLAFVIALDDLCGRRGLVSYPVHSLVHL